MKESDQSETDPKGEEAPYRSPQEVAEKPGDHEMPALGRAGDGTDDAESLARRPGKDMGEVDGDTDKDGMPLGTHIHGS